MSFEKERIGNCTLYRGDCREILPLLDPVDAVITDPPYGVELKAKVTKYNHIRATTCYPDDYTSIKGLIGDVAPWWLVSAKRAVITPGTRMLYAYPEPKAMGCIYVPNSAGIGRWGFQGWQPILYYGRDPYMATGGRPSSFYSAHPGMHVTKENDIDHPCPKPLAWMRWLVNRGSLPEETVLDMFAGSFTTGVAALEQGRAFIGIEIDPYYWEIGCRRIEEVTRQGDLFLSPPRRAYQEVLL